MHLSIPPENAKLLTIAKAAVRLGVSRRTVHNYIEQNRIDWVVTPTGLKRVVESSLFQAPESQEARDEFPLAV